MPTTELSHVLATRFVALDTHRQYLMVGAVDSQQQVVISPRRFGFAAFAEWAQDHFTHPHGSCLKQQAMRGCCTINYNLWSQR